MLTFKKYNSIENTDDRERVIHLFQQIKRQPALFVTPTYSEAHCRRKASGKSRTGTSINRPGLIKGSDSGKKNDKY